MMIKKVHLTNSNEATFVCPSCNKTKTVNVSRYSRSVNRTKVKSTCKCGCIWTSILERRKYYRMIVNVPCSCRHIGARGISESFAMRVVNLSSGGLRIKPDKNMTIPASSYVLGDPVIVDIHLGNNGKTPVKKAAFIKNLSENHIGAEFDDSNQRDDTISAYMFGQRQHQIVM
ncbi:MAG: PilZ domain-containing protein [Deltaproteobacteria bacterium]|nr:PilZ domain-containing protein [Deltaproteobacteria bacterium]